MAYTPLTGGTGPSGTYVNGVDQWNATVANQTRDNFADHETRVGANTTGLAGHETRLATAEGTIGSHGTTIANHETRLSTAEGTVSSQGTRLTTVENTANATAAANTGNVTLAGSPNYLTIAAQVITRALIDLAAHVTGRLPFANLTAASAASKLLGRGGASGAGDLEEITLGTGLAMTGTTLSATASGGGAVIQTITLTGTQANVTLTAGVTFLRCNNASLLTIQGLVAGTDGQTVIIAAVGAGQVDFVHQSGSATAANRLINAATVGTTPLAAGVGTATYTYDATTQRWRLKDHSQGAVINIPYAAGDFTATAGTWTVEAADVTAFQYYLQGKSMKVTFYLVVTTLSATATGLRLKVPGGHTGAGPTVIGGMHYNEPGAGWAPTPGAMDITTAGTLISLYRRYPTGLDWPISTNSLYVMGQFEFIVT